MGLVMWLSRRCVLFEDSPGPPRWRWMEGESSELTHVCICASPVRRDPTLLRRQPEMGFCQPYVTPRYCGHGQ